MCEWSVPDWAGVSAPSPPPDHLYSPPQTLVRCELQTDPLWAKMSSAGVSSKKRKKPDTKPQSQLAKSLNEKRRRELENVFIEELAELISASFADMSSLAVKPDKCAILQETVNQIRTIKEQEAATIDAVQQGEVSSSKQTILSTEVFGPLLLEALEGFLFVVNTEGKVEFVTENISSFIRYTREEVLGKSVYNILHHGDHARFSSCLLPSWGSIEGSTSSGLAGASGGSGPPSTASGSSTGSRNRTFNCRFLVKPPDDPDQTMEEKQQRVTKYENMQVVQMSSTQLAHIAAGTDRDDEGNEIGPCLMCVARRVLPSENHATAPIEQFSMKLDTHGKIIAIDTTGVSSAYLSFLNKDLLNRNLEDLVHSADVAKITAHMNETLRVGQATSPTYRVRVTQSSLQMAEKYILVQTKSRFFSSPTSPHETDFVMATHSIVGHSRDPFMGLTMGESSGSAVHHRNDSNSAGVSGPLTTSVNGANNTPSHRSSSSSVSSTEIPSTITLSNSTSFPVNLNSTDLDFGFDFPSSTWELGEERVWERPESRASLTPAPSPLAPTPATPFGPSAFPFSPPILDDKESGDDNSSAGGGSGTGTGGNPCRLRNLLMTKRESTDSESGQDATRNRNRILKGLLNQEEEEQQLQQQSQQGSSGPEQSPHSKPPANNNMLLKLLNEKSDDDDVEARAGIKKQNELLQRLLKDDENNQESAGNEDSLLKSLGFARVPTSPAESIGRGRKRPSSEDLPGAAGSAAPQQGDELGPNSAKRPSNSLLDSVPPSTPVSTSESRLCQKNKMLASLLAIRPSTPTTIPPIPASVISATPQDKLPRLPKHSNPPVSGWPGGTSQSGPTQLQPSGAPSSGTTLVTSRAGVHGQGIASPDYRWPGDESSSDPYLSHILDQVIEIAPDAIADSPALMNMINSMEAQASGGHSSPFQQDLINEKINEKMAINAIQKSLMQCETAVKNPVYNANQMSGAQSSQQFPPPPMYAQSRPRLPLAQLRQAPYAMTNQQQQHAAAIIHRNKLIQQQQQQQQQKQRLLQLQQQQHLLIPSNAAAASDPGIHNMDSLMNNTVAPNVSLQRSASVPDSQLSPVGSFGGTAGTPTSILNTTSQISPGQRQPYSPQPFSPVNGGLNSFPGSAGGNQSGNGSGPGGGGGGNASQPQSRLSPSSLQSFQQAQLSPRLSQAQSYPTQTTSWSQQTVNRLSIQQQQNPMLNAQLTGGNFNSGGGRSFNPGTPPGAGNGGGASSPAGGTARGGLPPVRSLTSPSARQSPFPPELSPTAAGAASNYQFRLQRSMSTGSGAPTGAAGPQHPPQATTHLPGGGGSGGGPGSGRMAIYKDQMSYHHYHMSLPHHQHPQQQHPQQQHHHPPPPPPPQPPHSSSGSSLIYPPQHHLRDESPYHHTQTPNYNDGFRPHPPSGGNNGMTEYVKHELRDMVRARTGVGGGGGGIRAQQQQQQQVGLSPHANLDTLGIAFELQSQGESPKMWNSMSEMGASSPQSASLTSRSALDDVNRTNEQKSSLLQKLLSE